MSELRLNNVHSFGTSNPITFSTGGTTTGTFTSAPAFATIVAPDFYKIIVEPDTANEEIVFLTAYTAGATTGTFTRAQEGSSGVAHSATKWAHGPTALDFNTVAVGAEANAAALINATSTGDAGGRATDFPGTSLPTGWAYEGGATTATAVGSSVAAYQAAGTNVMLMRSYTPSGVCRIEGRVRGSTDNTTPGLMIRDSGSGVAGEGMFVHWHNAGTLRLWSMDAGVFTLRQSLAMPDPVGALEAWVYFALARDGSNNWTGYMSKDRVLWRATASYAKTFTVAKAGMFGNGVADCSIDFFDVVS